MVPYIHVNLCTVLPLDACISVCFTFLLFLPELPSPVLFSAPTYLLIFSQPVAVTGTLEKQTLEYFWNTLFSHPIRTINLGKAIIQYPADFHCPSVQDPY